MEKSFRRYQSSPERRHAFVQAELVSGLAAQIRVLRQQRGLTQGQLARMLGTTQTAISRLEDASYGRYSLTTLLTLAQAFDVGLRVRFESLVEMLARQHDVSIPQLEVLPFDAEAQAVTFGEPTIPAAVIGTAANSTAVFGQQRTLGSAAQLTPSQVQPALEFAP